MQLTKQNYDLDVTDIIKKTKIKRAKMALENKERELLYHAKEIYNLFEKNSISEKEVLNIPIKKQINEENSKCGIVSQER